MVAAVGSAVTSFKAGDEVYSRVPANCRGSIAEYCLSTVSTTAPKPKSLSFVEAAAIPLAGMTALQALRRGDMEAEGGLKGKTVFVPAGLSGTGSFAVQLAKNVFGAGKVITTLSPGKMTKIREYLGEGTPDVLVDYTKGNVVGDVGKDSVDFMFDTVQNTVSALGLMKKGHVGNIVSVSTAPSGSAMRKTSPDVPLYIVYGLDLVDWALRSYTSWMGVRYSYLFLDGNAADLEKFSQWVEEGKVKPVVGSTAKLSDIEAVKKGCGQIFEGKGGVGKFVIEID